MLEQSVLERNRRLQSVIQPLNQILSKVSWYGLPLSKDVLLYKANKWKSRIVKAKHEMFELVGNSFNIDSPGEKGQVAKVLYKQFGMDKVYEKGKVCSTMSERMMCGLNKSRVNWRVNIEEL